MKNECIRMKVPQHASVGPKKRIIGIFPHSSALAGWHILILSLQGGLGKNRDRRNVWSLRTTSGGEILWHENFIFSKTTCTFVLILCSKDAHCAAEWAWKFSPDKNIAFSRKLVFSIFLKYFVRTFNLYSVEKINFFKNFVTFCYILLHLCAIKYSIS